tara:strand:- start:411 stop:716 length:306 start_codon:yes stop_codon:yes gene_type:complete
MTQHERNQIDTVEKKLDKILFYLLDDPETDSKGVISVVNDNKKRLDVLDTKGVIGTVNDNKKRLDVFDTTNKVKAGQVTVLSMVGGAAISLIAWGTSWLLK